MVSISHSNSHRCTPGRSYGKRKKGRKGSALTVSGAGCSSVREGQAEYECSETKKGSGVPGRARPHEALKVTVERKRIGAISLRF